MQNMPYVLLTDIMKQHTNNEDKARNSKTLKSRQKVEGQYIKEQI